MESKKLVLVLVSAVFVFGGAANAQKPTERRPRPGAPVVVGIPCPIPMNISLTAPPPVAATPFAADFPTASVVLEPNFGGTTRNRHFRHTFTWKPTTECCQYLSGKLTLQYEALSDGQSATSPDAGNDGVTIYKGGSALPPSQPVYPPPKFPVSAGQTGTKTFPLTPAMLTGDRLSFAVQDDTAVTSAKLEVVACCVRQ